MKVKAVIKYDGTVECLASIDKALNEEGKPKRYEVLAGDRIAVIRRISREEIFFGINCNEWFIVFRADYTDVVANRLPADSILLSANLVYYVYHNKAEAVQWLQDRPEIVYLAEYSPHTHSTYTGERYLRYEFRQSYYPLGYE